MCLRVFFKVEGLVFLCVCVCVFWFKVLGLLWPFFYGFRAAQNRAQGLRASELLPSPDGRSQETSKLRESPVFLCRGLGVLGVFGFRFVGVWGF